MNLLAPDTATGRAVRLPLRMVPPTRTMRMLAPRELRGSRWIAGAGLHSCWLGTFERSKRRLFADETRSGHVVFDVGAQAGYYSLLASRLVGPTGTVVAIEPLPSNLVNLRRHLALNNATNVTVVAAAAADHGGTAAFEAEASGYMGRLASRGDLEVEVRTLDEIAEAHGVMPDLIKMDVEGGETEALAGARRILTEGRPLVFLATHGPVPHAGSCELLTNLGYRLRPLDAATLADAREIFASPIPTASR
jgi:FkbM family methyltransferase